MRTHPPAAAVPTAFWARPWHRHVVAITAMFALLCCFAGGASAQERTLRLASDVWPPFTGAPGEPRVAAELVSQALKRANIKASLRMVDVGALTPALKSASFDGTAAIWRSPDREAYLLFSKPYLENRLVLVGRNDSDVSATSLSQLKGKRVAIVGAFAYGEALAKAEAPDFVRGNSDQENLKRLLSGDVDYMLVDDLLAYHLLHTDAAKAKKMIRVGTKAMIIRPLHFAVLRSLPNATRIIERFNAQIDRMMADGTIHRILQVKWIQTDVDGDGRPELVLGGTKAGKKAPRSGYEWLTMSRAPKAKRRSRIWIEGITYENWDDVPPRYKVEPEPWVPRQKGGLRLRFDIGL